MFLGTHSSEPSKFITVHLNPENDDFSVCSTPAPHKISSFSAWMEAWNIYLAIWIDHAPACAPQLVAYQWIITSASNQYSLVAWLNYDVHFRTLAASDISLQWDVRLTELWQECYSGTPPHNQMALCSLWYNNPLSRKLSFYAQSVSEPPRGQHPSPASTSTGGQHSPPTPGTV